MILLFSILVYYLIIFSFRHCTKYLYSKEFRIEKNQDFFDVMKDFYFKSLNSEIIIHTVGELSSFDILNFKLFFSKLIKYWTIKHFNGKVEVSFVTEKTKIVYTIRKLSDTELFLKNC